MKKLFLCGIMMAMLSISSFATTITVTNQSSTSAGFNCTCDVKLTSLTFHKSGASDWSYSEKTYTSIGPNGASHVWTITPPPGYTVDWSTLTMTVKNTNCNTTHNVGNANDSGWQGNCNSCNNVHDITRWTRISDGNYEVQADNI